MALPSINLPNPDFSLMLNLYPSSKQSLPVDSSYFSYWIPLNLATHYPIQGYTLSKWQFIQQELENSYSKTLEIACSFEEAVLFQNFLEQSKRVKNIFWSQPHLLISLKSKEDCNDEKPHIPQSCIPLDRPISFKRQNSYSTRFLETKTTTYLSSFRELLFAIKIAIEASQAHIVVSLPGADCLFFAHILRRFYRGCVTVAFVRQNYSLHLHLRKLEGIKRISQPLLLTDQIERLEEIMEKNGGLAPPHASAYFPKKFHSSPSTNVSVLLELDINSKFFNLKRCNLLTATHLAYQLRNKKAPSKEQWEPLWQKSTDFLFGSCLGVMEKNRPTIQKLALLKARLERHRFDLSDTIDLSILRQIDLYQTVRTLFPHYARDPLISVRINHKLLQWEQSISEKLPLNVIYYKSLFENFAREASVLINCKELALYLIALKENTGYVMNDSHFEPFFQLLQASSFSCFSYADSYLRKRIFADLLSPYQIKCTQPQNGLEFFLNQKGNFMAIRTAVYAIGKDQKEIGSFVMKFTSSFHQGKWSFALKIPSIDLPDSLSLKEQIKIYQKLLPQSST